MSLILKQSTSVVISMGPFLLNTDGVTLVVNLVGTGANQTESTTTGIRISKNGAAFIARHATATASTYDAFGNYLVTLDTTDTNTLGMLRIQFANGAAFCPVWVDCFVVTANVWDSLFGTTLFKADLTQILTTPASTPATAGILDVNVKNIDNDAASASGTVTFPNATLASTANITAGTITTVTNLTNAPTAGDLTATMKTSVTTAATAATPIAASVSGAVGSVTGAVGSVTGNVGGNVVGSVASVTAGVTLAAAAVQAIWDALTSALTTVGSIGKFLKDQLATAVSTAPTVAAIRTEMDSNSTKLANLDATISSRTKPADTQAAVTLVATTTNLTNAPGAGDLTAAMKASVTAAVPTVVQIRTEMDTNSTAHIRVLLALPAAAPNTASGLPISVLVNILDTINDGVADLGDTQVPGVQTSIDDVAESFAPLPAQILDLADGVEVGLTLRQALRLIAAASAGKLSGAATATVVIRNAVADSKPRITATVDSDGNRSAVVADVS